MAFAIVVGLIVLLGGVFSYVSMRSEEIAAKAWFRYGGLGVWVGLLILLKIVIGGPSGLGIFAGLLSGVCWFVFLASFFGNTVARWARSALSLDDIPERPGFSRVETLVRRGRHPEALKALREIADAHPADPEPCRRQAELLLKLDRVDDAVRAFRLAADRTPHPDDRAMVLFAMTETMVDRKGDAAGAIAALEGFILEFPDCRSRPYVDKRLESLRAHPAR
jgi:tetratricopeptide (TPR) repeat protein